MVSICRDCAFEQLNCKGNKSLEKIKCEFWEESQLSQIEELSEQIEILKNENSFLKQMIRFYREELGL